MIDALRFTLARYLSYFAAPLFPLLCVLVIVVFLIVFGLFHWIPVVGDIIVDGLGWPLAIFAGLAMAVILVGLIGWPMMYATISTEGSDSFDAISRSYSYVYQNPWHYLWYSAVALVYGAAVVFFVSFMGSLMVYLGKWGVNQTPFIAHFDRSTDYLFAYAPTSFGWRDLLLQGSPAVDSSGHVNADKLAQWEETFTIPNKIGAFMVSWIWMGLVFMIVVGFAYSYFWSASTIIYLFMRRKVDDTDVDEVYLEEDESDEGFPTPATAAAPVGAGEGSLTMVEAPTLKAPAPAGLSPTAVDTTRSEEEGSNQPSGGNPPLS
jgi:hypothetical protein